MHVNDHLMKYSIPQALFAAVRKFADGVNAEFTVIPRSLICSHFVICSPFATSERTCKIEPRYLKVEVDMYSSSYYSSYLLLIIRILLLLLPTQFMKVPFLWCEYITRWATLCCNECSFQCVFMTITLNHLVNAIEIMAKQYVLHLRRRTRRRSCVHAIDVEDLYGRQTTDSVSGLALWTVVERRETP